VELSFVDRRTTYAHSDNADAAPELQAIETLDDQFGVEPQLVRKRRAGRGHQQDA
jgi:hypothetical protein